MAIYKISLARIEYKNRKFHRKVLLGSFLIGELNYNKNINRLDRLAKSKGIQTLTQSDEMLSIETEEFTIKSLFNWETLTPFTRTNWELVGAESI